MEAKSESQTRPSPCRLAGNETLASRPKVLSSLPERKIFLCDSFPKTNRAALSPSVNKDSTLKASRLAISKRDGLMSSARIDIDLSMTKITSMSPRDALKEPWLKLGFAIAKTIRTPAGIAQSPHNFVLPIRGYFEPCVRL